MNKQRSQLLFVLQASRSNGDYLLEMAAFREGELIKSHVMDSLEVIRDEITSVMAESPTLKAESWIVLPHGDCSYHEIELTKKTLRYANSVISNYVEPLISSNLASTKIIHEVDNLTAKAVILSEQVWLEANQVASSLMANVTKIIAPQAIVADHICEETPRVLIDSYVYLKEQANQIIGLPLMVFNSIDLNNSTNQKEISIRDSSIIEHGNILAPNLLKTKKAESKSSRFTGWFTLPMCGMLMLSAAVTYANGNLKEEMNALKQKAHQAYASYFPGERILHLSQQTKAKISSAKSSNSSRSHLSYETLLKIENAVANSGSNGKIVSLALSPSGTYITWSADDQNSLKRIERSLQANFSNAFLKNSTKNAGGVLGDFEIKEHK